MKFERSKSLLWVMFLSVLFAAFVEACSAENSAREDGARERSSDESLCFVKWQAKGDSEEDFEDLMSLYYAANQLYNSGDIFVPVLVEDGQLFGADGCDDGLLLKLANEGAFSEIDMEKSSYTEYKEIYKIILSRGSPRGK